MVELVIFDLDGVLADIKDVHYESLNQALSEINDSFVLSKQEHLVKYDGLSTKQKMLALNQDKGLPQEHFTQIFERKQFFTIQILENSLQPSPQITELLHQLIRDGFKLAVASNAIRATIEKALEKLQIRDCFDLILSNEDVEFQKPSPQIYLKAMYKMNIGPRHTLVVEDSPKGIFSAEESGARVCRVKNSSEVSIQTIYPYLGANYMNQNKQKLNIVIPMAGRGSRFQEAGYTFPKPLIEINEKPMIQWVVENIGIDANYIFITQKQHLESYGLKHLLNLICPNNVILTTDGVTEGAACTVLLAEEYINNDTPLFMINSDQYMEWNRDGFLYFVENQDLDGAILTHYATHPKWSFARTDENNKVLEVAEKKPISNVATVGAYYWSRGSDFVSSAKEMIEKNIRTNNEFYICPAYNEAIEKGANIYAYFIDKMWGLGTPEDLDYFKKEKGFN